MLTIISYLSVSIVFAPKISADTLTALAAAVGVVRTVVFSYASCADAVAAAVADKPRPLDWILFTTTMAGYCYVSHGK